ncbi:MAG: mercury resistance system periplasmic binding protein MerP [Burkholderiales bacterium]
MVRSFWLSLALVISLPAHAEPRTVTLDVKGMNCATCPITVRIALKKVAGVREATVTLEPAVAEVIYDDARATPEQLTRATADAGFPSSVRRRP